MTATHKSLYIAVCTVEVHLDTYMTDNDENEVNKSQMPILRNYQEKLIHDIRLSIHRHHKSVLAVLGCGGGKSIIQAEIARSATEKHNNVLFLVHRKELCEQIENTFINQGVDMSLCSVSMVQTVSRRLKTLPVPCLIITDEAHHSNASNYRKIYDYFPNAIRLGFTATPCRLDGSGLSETYDDMIVSVSTKWLIDNNYLSPYKYYSVKLADTSKLHSRCGEYNSEEVANLMENHKIYGETVKEWLRLAFNKKTIIYCASVKASEETAERFRTAGYDCISLSGQTPKNEREEAVQMFREGKIKILCNCDLFGEGFDVPDCECTILLRPTKSLTLFIQQSMRSMRYMPNKTAIIIDHVGNCYQHGLPDDDRLWDLHAKKKKKKGNSVPICKECPECFRVVPYTKKQCECGYIFRAVKQARPTETVDIKLEEIKQVPLSEFKGKTWEEVVSFQKAKKYKFGWCIRYAQQHGIKIPGKYNYMIRRFFNNGNFKQQTG